MFDTGNTGFMLIATSLVLLMTPGLALFYGGLVGKKNVLAIMMQSFVSMGITTILWGVVGYSMCFSGDAASHTDFFGIVGNFKLAFLTGIGPTTPAAVNPTIPLFVFVAYQLMTAIITPALITGAFTNRIRFSAYIAFLVLWLLFVYFPFVHMVWGGGILASWGVKDFAGGIVVHNIAGFAALASVFFVGKRKVSDSAFHSIPLFALGAGLLWFGWFGFNAGNQFRVDGITVIAFLNTHIAASFAAIAWLALDWRISKKPKLVGLLTGALAGLVVITPAAGYVSPKASAAIGLIGGIVCYFAVALKNKLGWDDSLDVWGVHGVGGFTGIICVGIFGWAAINSDATNGILHGGSGFFGIQVLAVVISSFYAFGFTYGMLWLINKVIPVKMTEREETAGMDSTLHGEEAYAPGIELEVI
jgi:ammonium transporter, Amt family